MAECNPTSTPMEVGIKLSTFTDSPLINESLYWKLVGSLIYITTTQLDLCFASALSLSQFMSNLEELHWQVAK